MIMLDHMYKLCKIMASHDTNYTVIIMLGQVIKHLDFIQKAADFTGCLPRVYLHFVSQKLIRKQAFYQRSVSNPIRNIHYVNNIGDWQFLSYNLTQQ